jgi:glycosyltransferase involved in cell wall biosynthesis
MTMPRTDCKKLRVLLRAPYPPPFGGIASLMVSLLPGLKECGAEDVAVLHYGTTNATDEVDGATIHRYNVKSQTWRLLLPQNWPTFILVWQTFRGARLGLRRLVSEAVKTILIDRIARERKSNVVSFYQSDTALELLACKQKWGRSRGIVLTVFGEVYDNPEFIKPRRDLFHRLLNAPEALAASSQHCARSFRTIEVDRAVDVIYVGVDMKRFADEGSLRTQYREELGLDDDEVMCLFMGRFNSEMGLDRLIQVIPAALRRDDRIRFVLAGAKGPLVEPAQRCREEHPDRVIVMNDVPFAVQPSLYAAADLVLTPSRDQHACMGVTIKEAMAAARTVIGTDSGGIPEAIVHDETGWIVPLKPDGQVDNDAYEMAILSLARDAGRRDEMGRKARQRAAELFKEEVTIERTARMFMSCLPRA